MVRIRGGVRDQWAEMGIGLDMCKVKFEKGRNSVEISNFDPRQIITPLALVGLGLVVGEG